MREIRIDPTTGEEVVLATARVGRPNHLRPGRAVRTPPEDCPFCPGNEAKTPPLIAETVLAGEWQARAFANRFPALAIEGSLEGRAFGPYAKVSGLGAHEVVVESRLHDDPVWSLPDGGAAAFVLAQARMRDLARDVRLKYLCWFRNVGPEAGGSMSHPHAQLLALPRIPPRVKRMFDRFEAHLRETERELLQDLLNYELEKGERVIWEGRGLVALCPWAPQMPFEVWFVPSRPQGSWLEDSIDLAGLAEGMAKVLRAQAKVLASPSYNACLYQAPVGGAAGFRWHVRLMPRLGAYGGFELISGSVLHGVPPEESARLLRENL